MLFLWAKFARKSSALEMLRPYMGTVAAPARSPKITLVFFGPGEDDRSFLMCDSDWLVRVSGQAVAPPSFAQAAEGFRKQGQLYRWKDGRRVYQ